MADEDINPVVLLADPKVNHRVWAACLKWSPVVKKQRVPSHQKHKPHVKSRRLTSLKVTVGSRSSRGKISRITGTGILARPERNHYFSLALAFCSWVRMDTASSGTAIRSFYSLPPLMASLPLWLICQEMMLMLLKRSVFF